MTFWQVAVVVAAGGVVSGYLVAESALFKWTRETRWERGRHIMGAAVFGDLLDWIETTAEQFDSNPDSSPPPFGSLAVDLELFPEIKPGPPSPGELRVWRWRWRKFYLLTCNVCFGFWGGGVVAVAVGVAAVVSVVEVDVVSLCGGALVGLAGHLLVTSSGNRYGWWC